MVQDDEPRRLEKFADLRTSFRHPDVYCDCVVFDIKETTTDSGICLPIKLCEE